MSFLWGYKLHFKFRLKLEEVDLLLKERLDWDWTELLRFAAVFVKLSSITRRRSALMQTVERRTAAATVYRPTEQYWLCNRLTTTANARWMKYVST